MCIQFQGRQRERGVKEKQLALLLLHSNTVAPEQRLTCHGYHSHQQMRQTHLVLLYSLCTGQEHAERTTAVGVGSGAVDQ